jgi:beta-N-acetylhexosaminidase
MEASAPYYLDSTEISKIDAYFTLYSKASPCIETAARLLFRDATALGDSPVSVDGIGYNLLTVLSPDPGQLISIGVEREKRENPGPTPTPEETPTGTLTPEGYSLGDTLILTAGPLVDHNQHIVPDGTVIRFQISFSTGNIPPLYIDTTTVGGMGVVQYSLDRQGDIEITAFSEPAMNSTIIKLSTGEQPVILTPTPESGEESIPTAALSATPTPSPTEEVEHPAARTGLGTLTVTLLVTAVLAAGGILFSRVRRIPLSPWRIALMTIVGGLAGYDYIAVGLPGAQGLVDLTGSWISILFSGIGCAAGLIAAFWGRGILRLPDRSPRKSG